MRQRQEAGPEPPAAFAAEELSEIFHALSNPARLAIVRVAARPGQLPAAGEARRGGWASASSTFRRGPASPSPRLRSTCRSSSAPRLVTSTRIGQWTHYKRNDALLRRLGQQLATEL